MRLQRWIISTLLVLLVLAVYWPVKNYDFVNVNDFEYVSKNDHINADFSWPGVRWALTSQVAANWHPVTVFSHMLDCQIYGLNAGGHHFTSVLLHLASVLLLFSILLKMTTKTPEDLAANFWPCAVVTALFALHPLRVESVVWISERKDVLSVFFFMLTLWSYLHYVKKKEAKSKGGTWYFLALLFFALGLMSKPMLVTLPCALLLLDYWPLKRVRVESESEAFSFGKLFLEKIPFFLLTVVFSVVTFLTQKGAGAMGSLEKLPISARLANAMVSYARYLGKTVWPDSLAVLYPMPEGWAAWKIAGAVALFVTLSLFAIFNVRRKPYLFMGWFWFVGMLVPVIGLVQVGTQAMADRFTYLPSIGLFMAVVWGLSDIFAAWNKRVLIPVTGAILAVGCVAVTANQVHYWQDTETLLQHTVALTGKNPRANATLGTTFANKNQWAEAERHLGKAIEEKPDFAEAYGDLGGVYARQGKLDDAQHAYEKALQLKPALPLAHFGLANLLMKKGQIEEPISHLNAVLKLKPDFAQAHFYLAILLARQHDPAASIAHLQQAVQLKPDWIPAINSLAWNLATQPDDKLRNGKEAMNLALRAESLTRRNEPGVLDTLAAAYAETGQFANAIETAESARQKAIAVNQMRLAQEIETHLKMYQLRQPVRE